MSNMKRLVMKLMIALLVNAIVGGLIALAVGVASWIGAVALNVIVIAIGACLPKDALRAGVFTEVWTGELVKSLRGGLEGSWLDGVPDQSSIVNNDVIHLVEVGVDPDVLINNTTYPIPSQALEDKDIAVKLDKFQTKVTPITDDELYAASYDKMARVKESHGNSINDSKFTKAAHALCAQENTAKTPVLKTTGERDAETGRLRLTMADLVALKAAMDKLHVPAENRRLVLCSDHVNDLLLVSQTFREQYNIDRATGKVGKLYGFDVYEYANTPLYTQAGKKKALGVAAGAGEFNCSFAFYTPRVFKATGSTKMYYSEAATDPEYQRNKINFRHYFLCMPKKADAGVVMMSGYKAS
nr:MAG TPA: Major capsid protein [Caudoviricetes sp.]